MGKEDGKFPSHPQKEKSMAQRKIRFTLEWLKEKYPLRLNIIDICIYI